MFIPHLIGAVLSKHFREKWEFRRKTKKMIGHIRAGCHRREKGFKSSAYYRRNCWLRHEQNTKENKENNTMETGAPNFIICISNFTFKLESRNVC